MLRKLNIYFFVIIRDVTFTIHIITLKVTFIYLGPIFISGNVLKCEWLHRDQILEILRSQRLIIFMNEMNLMLKFIL